jgi:hypothetical protein
VRLLKDVADAHLTQFAVQDDVLFEPQIIDGVENALFLGTVADKVITDVEPVKSTRRRTASSAYSCPLRQLSDPVETM